MSGLVVVQAGERKLAAFDATAERAARREMEEFAVTPVPDSVPVDERTVVELHVRRGDYLVAVAWACAHCEATFTVTSAPFRAAREVARKRGWRAERGQQNSWVCPGCVAAGVVA